MLNFILQSLLVCNVVLLPCTSVGTLPLVINTWPFLESNIIGKLVFENNYVDLLFCMIIIKPTAASTVANGSSYLDAIERGCIAAEQNTSIDSVGYGGR